MSQKSKGQIFTEKVRKTMDEKFEYYNGLWGWTAKNPEQLESTLRRFFEWGFTDGVELTLDEIMVQMK